MKSNCIEITNILQKLTNLERNNIISSRTSIFYIRKYILNNPLLISEYFKLVVINKLFDYLEEDIKNIKEIVKTIEVLYDIWLLINKSKDKYDYKDEKEISEEILSDLNENLFTKYLKIRDKIYSNYSEDLFQLIANENPKGYHIFGLIEMEIIQFQRKTKKSNDKEIDCHKRIFKIELLNKYSKYLI